MVEGEGILEDLIEARHPVLRGRGIVGPSKDGLSLRRQDDGHRPTPIAPVEGLNHRHVNLVDVGALLSVHLDADVMLVQIVCDSCVFEGFMGHDVTPVAGGIANAEQDGFIVRLCRLKSFCTPRVPVNGMVGVLTEIERVGVVKTVMRHVTVLAKRDERSITQNKRPVGRLKVDLQSSEKRPEPSDRARSPDPHWMPQGLHGHPE